MKILELLEPSVSHQPIKTKRKMTDFYKNRKSGPNPFLVDKDYETGEHEQLKNKLVKTIGGGAFGTAFQHESRPGEVTKTSKPTKDLTGDGYYKYISTILKNNRMQSNPYFPKIYGMKVYQTPDEWYFYVVKMEKLYPLTDLSEDEMAAIVEKTLHIKHFTPDDASASLNDVDETLRKVIATIERGIGHGNHQNFPNKRDVTALTNIKDPQLKQAVMVSKQFTRSGEHNNDIHSANVMFRRTQHGAQLVITDPLS